MASSPQPTSLAAPLRLVARRCWRCLEMFPVAVVAGDGVDGWWLRRPCAELPLAG